MSKRSSSGSRLSSLPLRVNQGRSALSTVTPSTSNSQRSRSPFDGNRSSFGSGRSSFGARPSTANPPRVSKFGLGNKTTGNNKRLSSGYGTMGHGARLSNKDPRPLSDKQFLDKSARGLLEFLQENQYMTHSPNTALNMKLLLSPSSKEFVHMFEFLYQFIVPDFKIGKKHEEEIPKRLKDLGYPFTISKSHMLTIGTAHAMPYLLGALTWLREQIQHILSIDVEHAFIPVDFDSDADAKLLFNHSEITYRRFLVGDDDFLDEEDEVLENQLFEQQGVATLEKAAEENMLLQQELELLMERGNKIPKLKEDELKLRGHIDSMHKYRQELEAHKSKNAMKMQELEQDMQTLSAEVVAVEEDISRKQLIFNTQEFTQADIERIQLTQRQRKKEEQLLETQIADVDKQIWDQEMSYTKSRDQVESKRLEYNKILSTMPDLINSNLHLEDTLSTNRGMSVHHLKHIMPSLKNLKGDRNNRLHECRMAKENEVEALTMFQDMHTSKQGELRQLEADIVRAEEELQQQKEAADEEKAVLQGAISSSEEMLQMSGREGLMKKIEANDARDALARKLKSESARCHEESEQYCDFLTDVMGEVVKHKQAITDHVNNVFHAEVSRIKGEAEARLAETRQKAKDGTLFRDK